MFPFPTVKRDPEGRERWKRAVNRPDYHNPGQGLLLEPTQVMRVCSVHFVNGRPTADHPDPSLHLGYDLEPPCMVQRVMDAEEPEDASLSTSSLSTSSSDPSLHLGYDPEPPCKVQRVMDTDLSAKEPEDSSLSTSSLSTSSTSSSSSDPSLHLRYDPEPPCKVQRVMDKDLSAEEPEDSSLSTSSSSLSVDISFCTVVLMSFILILVGIIYSLEKQIAALKSELAAERTVKASRKMGRPPGIATKCLKSDADVLFFTGVPTKNLFYELHDYIAKFIRRHWKGTTSSSTRKRKFFNSPSQFGPQRKLSSVDEFLLTCMKLKLGLLNCDLSSRFNISLALTSNIFHTWLNAMYKTIGKYVCWASKEEIISSKPLRYRHLPNLRAIIDCSEIFIETPKDPVLQTSTWSDYKHHNTLKFLIAVAPNSAITFVSPAYPGRHSDTQITRSSGFLDRLDEYDEIMADRGFLIQTDCDIRHITLSVPPTKRGLSQMTTAAVVKTKRIANLRIIVEQVIRRLKTFRILSNEMPITVVPLASKIIVVCAGLSNLRNPLYKS